MSECVKASLHFSNPPYYSNVYSKLTLGLADGYTLYQNQLFSELFLISCLSLPLAFKFLCLGFFSVH